MAPGIDGDHAVTMSEDAEGASVPCAFEEEGGEARGKLVALLDRMEDTLRRTARLAGNACSIAADEIIAVRHPRVGEWRLQPNAFHRRLRCLAAAG